MTFPVLTTACRRRSPTILGPLLLAVGLLGGGCAVLPGSPDPASEGSDGAVPCPATRDTPRAPDAVYAQPNPLPATPENIQAGRRLYLEDARPVACVQCHGTQGDGRGPIGRFLDPPPANFTCRALYGSIPDGQIFWVIENGSDFLGEGNRPLPSGVKRPGRRQRGTATRPHRFHLDEEQIWQLVHYLRTFHELR